MSRIGLVCRGLFESVLQYSDKEVISGPKLGGRKAVGLGSVAEEGKGEAKVASSSPLHPSERSGIKPLEIHVSSSPA